MGRPSRFSPEVRERAVRLAKLPEHFTPHSLRHTYAVLQLQRGTPISYVQHQLGHASITMTVDVYGRWMPSDDKRFATWPEDAEESLAPAVNKLYVSPAAGRPVTRPATRAILSVASSSKDEKSGAFSQVPSAAEGFASFTNI